MDYLRFSLGGSKPPHMQFEAMDSEPTSPRRHFHQNRPCLKSPFPSRSQQGNPPCLYNCQQKVQSPVASVRMCLGIAIGFSSLSFERLEHVRQNRDTYPRCDHLSAWISNIFQEHWIQVWGFKYRSQVDLNQLHRTAKSHSKAG